MRPIPSYPRTSTARRPTQIVLALLAVLVSGCIHSDYQPFDDRHAALVSDAIWSTYVEHLQAGSGSALIVSDDGNVITDSDDGTRLERTADRRSLVFHTAESSCPFLLIDTGVPRVFVATNGMRDCTATDNDGSMDSTGYVFYLLDLNEGEVGLRTIRKDSEDVLRLADTHGVALEPDGAWYRLASRPGSERIIAFYRALIADALVR